MNNNNNISELMIQINLHNKWIKECCVEFSSIEFASEAPHTLTRVILKLSDILIEHADYWKEASQYDKDAIDHLRKNLRFQRTIGSFFEFIHNSTINLVSWSLIEPLQNILSNILKKDVEKKDVDLFLSSVWEYNFSVLLINLKEGFRISLYKDFQSIGIEKLENVLAEFDKDFYLLLMPSNEKLNPLRLALISHEIGHFVAKDVLSKEFKEKYRDLLESKYKSTSTETANKQVLEEISDIWQRGLQETISDYFGVRLWGFPVAFALNSIANEVGLDQPDSPLKHGYPSWGRRLKVVVKALEFMNILKVDIEKIFSTEEDSEIESKLSDWYELLKAEDGIRKNKINELIGQLQKHAINVTYDYAREDGLKAHIAYSLFEQALNEALEIVEKEYKHCLLEADAFNEQFYDEVPDLVKQLVLGIPPNVVLSKNKTASLTGILNAICIWQVTKYGSEKFDEDSLKELSKNFKLCLRAIEMSHLQKIYQKNMENN